MKTRCLNPARPNYHRYGGRGVTVCQAWIDSFEAFLADVGPKPLGTSLGRIDNDGNYEPGNVRWETTAQQQKNKADNRFITIGGKTKILSDWSDEAGISKQVLRYRIANWPKKLWLIKARQYNRR